LEAGPHLLAGFHEKLIAYAETALERLHVEVRLNTPVEKIDADGVAAGGERIDASVVIWCAGVKATPIAAWLGTPTTRKGAIKVAPDLSVPGVSNIFAIGDAAAVDDQCGKPLPLVAPVAKQEGAYVARVIRSRLDGKAPPSAFGYRDPGSLAIIGRAAAAVDFGFIQITGFVGWLVGICPHFLLDRFPKQNCCIPRVGLGMADLCSRRPADHRTSRSASRGRSTATTMIFPPLMMIVINSPPIRCSSASTHHLSDLRLMSSMPI
jgi:NADH dehydrogenase FAD-containing subunit